MTGSKWFIVETTSTKEKASCLVLERLGYSETFFPKRWVDGRPKGKKARAKSNKPNWVERAWVSGYVFVCAEHIAVHRINGSHGKLHMRIVSPGGVPYEVSDEDMAQMQDVPQRVKALVEEARQAEIDAWKRVQPQVGKLAKLVAGPFAGHEGIVREIEGDTLQIEVGAFPVTARAKDAQRVDVNA